jgi:hypothetical protein
MRVSRVAAVVGLLALAPVRVWAQTVTTDHDPSYDFSKVKTFSVQLANPWGNQLAEKRVVGQTTQALTEKGWSAAASPDASDVVVMLHGSSQTKHDLNTFYSGMGGYGWRGWGGGMGTATTSVSDYRVGTLVLDIFDAKTKSLVFRGTASGELSDKPEKNQKKLNKVFEKMLKNFPPTLGKTN